MISGMIGQQNQMFQGYNGYAQSIGAGMYPPQPPQGLMGVRPGQAGMYGEQVSMQMANAGRTATTGMGMVAGLGANMMGIPTDPMGGALMGAFGGMGGGIGGVAMGALGGTGIGLAIYGATKAVGAYANAFQGGMQDQSMLNSSIRSNFQQFGGQGANGRGFGQNQMGQIGSMIRQELKGMPNSNVAEMSGLIAGGAESGLMTGTRDVQAFTQNFRKMLDTLKSVQKELGGSLTEALSFVRSSQQAGIYQNADRVNFASEIRSAEAVTGMDRNQLIALSAQGANIARSYGAHGSQGALGVLKAAQTMGAAISSGSVSQELLSEATGGLTGADAIAAFSARTMQRSGAFSKSARGRLSLFAMSNSDGSGLDASMMDRFMTGDLSVSDVRGAAHRNVRGMGRAHALNQESNLRGEIMEQGGMAAQIGMMRLQIGDRVLDQGDDIAKLVMRRRFGMSEREAEVNMGLLHNQRRIAETEAVDRAGARRSQERATDIAEHRGFDAFTRQLEVGLSDAVGLTKAREMGAHWKTKISSLIERAGNDLMGTAASAITATDIRTINRMVTGMASSQDLERLGRATRGGDMGARNTRLTENALFDKPLASKGLDFFGIHSQDSIGRALAVRGAHIQGVGAGDAARQAYVEAQDARRGSVSGASAAALTAMEADIPGTTRKIQEAQVIARVLGDPNAVYAAMGGSLATSNAADAFQSRTGGQRLGAELGSLENVGPQKLTFGMFARDALRGASILGGVFGAASTVLGAATLGLGHSEVMDAMRTQEEVNAQSLSGLMNARATDMESLAGRTSESVEESYQYLLSAQTSQHLSPNQASQQQASFLMLDKNRQAIAAGGMRQAAGNLENLAVLNGNQEYQDNLAKLISGGSPQNTQEALTALRDQAAHTVDEGQRTAMESVATLVQADMDFGGGTLSQATRGALGRTQAIDKDRQQAILDARRSASKAFSSAASRMSDPNRMSGMTAEQQYEYRMRGGVTDEHVAGQLAHIGQLFNDPLKQREATTAAETLRQEMASRSATDAGRLTFEGAMGGTEEGRAFLSATSETRALQRNMEGRGRRGKRDEADAALGLVTGGTFSEGHYAIVGRDGHERVLRNEAEVLRVMRQGGANAERLIQQVSNQARIGGRMGSDSEGLVRAMVAQSSQGFSAGDVNSLQSRARRAGTEMSAAAADEEKRKIARDQEKADPLGVKRNQILVQLTGQNTTINQTLWEIVHAVRGESTTDSSRPR